LWEHLKNVIYSTPSLNVQDLKNKIVNAYAELQRDQILAATQMEVTAPSAVVHGELNFEQFVR